MFVTIPGTDIVDNVNIFMKGGVTPFYFALQSPFYFALLRLLKMRYNALFINKMLNAFSFRIMPFPRYYAF